MWFVWCLSKTYKKESLPHGNNEINLAVEFRCMGNTILWLLALCLFHFYIYLVRKAVIWYVLYKQQTNCDWINIDMDIHCN